MRRFDLSPLLRSSVGFDHLNQMLDSALTGENDGRDAYPPYNIEKVSEDDYRITMAVAGFTIGELNVTLEDGTLLLIGKANPSSEERSFIHRGIAKRAFERRFELADTIEVGEAIIENGLLSVDLKRVIPDHKKPRHISINDVGSNGGHSGPKTIEAEKSETQAAA